MQAVVDALKAWQLHPVVDHFSVALIIIAIATDLVASLIPSRLWIRNMAVTLMVLGAIAVAGSNVTGGWEADRLWDHVTGPAKDVLQRHATIGFYLPFVFGALALWRLGIQFVGFIGGSRPLYLLVAVVAAVAILYQGHEGGELVYTYGVGTAVLPTEAATPSPFPSAAPAEAIPAPMPSTTATPAAPASPVPSAASSSANPPSPSIAASPGPSVAPSPAATPAESPSGGTPVNPPSGPAASSAAASPGAPKSL
ncbi:MAG TPA: DUF2231 domain-containing protein [Candidatus Binataceae bacterium]|nr:DUF2231 domain-containing protein [Candidatus Binataceae bacterium]